MFQFHQDVFTVLGFAALALIVVLPVRGQLLRSLRGLLSIFNGLGPLRKFAVLALIAHLTMFAGGKHGGTNDVDGADLQNGEAASSPLAMNGRFRFLTSGEDAASPLAVTEEDIARGWQLWEVRTNGDLCYTMPEGAMMASNWWVRGAYEDVKMVEMVERECWRFPFGTNEYDSVWAFSWGKVRFALADTNTEIVAVGAPMSAVPYRSRLWTAETTNSTLITWEDFTLGRQQLTTNNQQLTTLSAQIELRRNGDFITRSNEVETVCRRLDPEDWDGDGWENGDDPDPYSWEEFWDDFYQELPDGDYACNYCWIEIRPQWNSWIVFEGDGPSNLDDPCFWGKAGETYRVQLLIGKTYNVMSSQPLSVVGQSNEAIAVSGNGTCSLSVVWPVTFTIGEGRYAARSLLGATWNDGGKSFHVLHDPPFLRGTNVWWGGCCSISGDGTNFTFACDNTCTCEGCMAYGCFTYSGYTLDLPGWFECGCHYVPDEGPAEVSIYFDRSAVIYEDAYTNQPGEVVHPARSNVVLRCSVSGGTYGGSLSVTLSDAAHQKLSMVSGDILPNTVRIEPGTSRSYEVVYSVLEPSGSVGDIQAAAIFREDFLNVVHSKDTSMTSVKVELEAVYEAPANPNPSRHIYGVGEKVNFKVTPQSSEIKLKTAKLDVGDFNGVYELFDGITNEADADVTHVYVCPISANYHPPIRVELDTVEYRPRIELIEPQIIVTPEASWTTCHNMGEVGQSKLVTENFIGPTNVSFRGIMIAEIPCDEEIEPIGYFATTNFTGFRSHTMGSGGDGAGAGYSRRVQGRNRWTTDEAGGGLYPNWSPGRLEWKIPIGWLRVGRDEREFGAVERVERERFGDPNSRPLLIGGCTDAYKQVMTIDDNGTSKIEKFGHWLSRGRYCRIILDGETKQWFHPLW